mgnify:FL=1
MKDTKLPDYIIRHIERNWWMKLTKKEREMLSNRKRMPSKRK